MTMQSKISLSISRVEKFKIEKKSPVSFCKIKKDKPQGMKVMTTQQGFIRRIYSWEQTNNKHWLFHPIQVSFTELN